MRSFKQSATALAVASVAIAGLAATAAPANAAPSTSEGCRAGYVCLYPQNAGWNGGHPSKTWYHYGAYNLSNQYGKHRFFNNQTGKAVGHLCTGYNGGGKCVGQPTGTWSDDNFTPINSVTLTTK
jgi:hypothetical protein